MGWGWSIFLGESQSRIYPNVCQIWLRSDGRVEKKGGVQTDKGTLQLYIVEEVCFLGPFSYTTVISVITTLN